MALSSTIKTCEALRVGSIGTVIRDWSEVGPCVDSVSGGAALAVSGNDGIVSSERVNVGTGGSKVFS
jgi:hypothetical protein